MALVGASAEKSAADLRAATQILIGRRLRDAAWTENWLLALASESWQVRSLAVAVGGQLGPTQRPYERLIQGLESDNTGLRNSVISLLLGWGPSATNAVVDHYVTASVRVRKFLIDGLRHGAPELVLPFLHKIWDESDFNLRVSILETVGAVGGIAARDFVWQHRQSMDNAVLRVAALDAMRLNLVHYSDADVQELVGLFRVDESTHRALVVLAGACKPVLATRIVAAVLPGMHSTRRMREALEVLAAQVARDPMALQVLEAQAAVLWSAVDRAALVLPPLLAWLRSGVAGDYAWIPSDIDATILERWLRAANMENCAELITANGAARVAALCFSLCYLQHPAQALAAMHARIWAPCEEPEPLLAAVASCSPLAILQWLEQALALPTQVPPALGTTELVLNHAQQLEGQAILLRAAHLAHNPESMRPLMQLAFHVHFAQPPAFALLELRSPVSRNRALALELVASIDGYDVEPVLRAALLDDSDVVFRAALDVLVQRPTAFRDAILEELWSRTTGWQQWAVFRAMVRSAVDVCALLERGFVSDYPPVVLDTVTLAQRCDPAAAASALRRCLGHTDPAIVARAIDWYRIHQRTLPLDVLKAKALDPSTMVRLASWSYVEAQSTMTLETQLLQTALENEMDPHLFLRISQVAGRSMP